MISVEDKIDIFTQELVNQLNEYKESSLSKTEAQNQRKEELADKQIKEQNENIKKRFKRLENKNVSRILAEGKNEARDLILETKKELRNDFNESLNKRISQIINTEGYKDYIMSSLTEIGELLKDSDELTLLITSEEKQLFSKEISEILSNFNINYQDLLPKYIGGFIVHDQDNRVSYDFSLNNLLLENNKITNTIFNQLINGDIN